MEKITIKLPENISEITLDQYQKFEALRNREDLKDDIIGLNKRAINIFTDLKYKDIDNIPYKDYDDITKQITKALLQSAPFQQRFKIQDIEFGFHPNLDEMTTAEFVDLSNWGLNIDNYHKLMAVLYRPITSKDKFGNYKIASYTGTKEYSDVMKQMTMDNVYGALGFFSHLANELRMHTLKYTKVDQAKTERATTLKSGDGMLQSVV